MIQLSAKPITVENGLTYTIRVSGKVRLITSDPNHVAGHLARLGVVSPKHLLAEAIVCLPPPARQHPLAKV